MLRVAALVSWLVLNLPGAHAADTRADEDRIATDGASLYVRTIGHGPAIIVLHGGPDFDHAYLLPDLDRLADTFRLIYYDQRGRGNSAAGVDPARVTLVSDLDDIDRVRAHFGLQQVVLLGHSWGTVLALEYALRHSANVSHLILLNPAPMSTADFAALRSYYLQQLGSDMDRQREIAGSAAYRSGDPQAVAARYRIHFKPALQNPQDYEKLMAAMKAQFMRQGSEGILKARAAEDRLMLDTWQKADYDSLPALKSLRIPTLIVTGDQDFIPVSISEHIAGALADAELSILKNCGHFSYLEQPDQVRSLIDDFARRTNLNQARQQTR